MGELWPDWLYRVPVAPARYCWYSQDRVNAMLRESGKRGDHLDVAAYAMDSFTEAPAGPCHYVHHAEGEDGAVEAHRVLLRPLGDGVYEAV